MAPSDDAATGDDILYEFFNQIGPGKSKTGTGAANRHFGEKSFMTRVMKDAPAVIDARKAAMERVKRGDLSEHTFNQPHTLPGDDISKMIWNRVSGGAGGNTGFIGGYTGWVKAAGTPSDFTLTIHIDNTTSKESGGGVGPDRSVNQIWQWTEHYKVMPGRSSPELAPAPGPPPEKRSMFDLRILP